MVPWVGFVYASLAALGHSGIDATRKLASRSLSSAELVALVGLLDAFYLTILVFSLRLCPSLSSLSWPLLQLLVLSSAVKILAGVMYQKALQLAPISLTVPYLAFVPALILLTGFLLLGELPSLQGIAGVCVVTLGGYLLALNTTKGTASSKQVIRGVSLAHLHPDKELGDASSSNASLAAELGGGPHLHPLADVEPEMEIGAGLLRSAGTPTMQQQQQALRNLAKATPALTTAKDSSPFSPPKRPRPATPSTSAVSRSDSLSLWDFSFGSRSRLGLGVGVGVGRVRDGSPRTNVEAAEVSKGQTTASASTSKPRTGKDKDRGSLGQGQGSPAPAETAPLLKGSSAPWIADKRLSMPGRVLEWLRGRGLEEGALLMLCCAGCLSLTNGFDKLGLHNSPSVLVFAWLQRLFMAFPPAAYLFFSSPSSFKQLLRHFPILSAVSFFEIVAIVFYLKSVQWLLVSYAVAAKRINILVSVLVGHFVFKENIWRRLPYILIMMLGMLLVIFAPT